MDRIGHVRIWFKVTKGPVVVERPVDHRCHHGKRRACLALVQGHVEDGLGFDVDCPGSHIVATVVCKRLKLNHLGFHESRHIGQNVGGFCAVVGASVFKGPFVGDRALTRVGQGWGKRRAQAIHDLKRCVRTGQRGHRPCFLGDAVVVIDNPRRGLEHHLQGWVADVRVGYSEACVTAAVSKLPCHRPVCHGGKVHGHRRTAFIHVAGQGQFWRGQHVNGLSHRCTAMGIADVQSHAVGAGRIEQKFGMLVVGGSFAAKRPIPAFQRLRTIGQAQVCERGHTSFTYRSRRECRQGRRENLDGFVGRSRTAIEPCGGERKDVGSHGGDVVVVKAGARNHAAVREGPLVGCAFVSHLDAADLEFIATLCFRKLDFDTGFGQHGDFMGGLGHTGFRIVVKPHSDNNVVRVGLVVVPRFVSRKGHHIASGAIKVPFEPIRFGGGGYKSGFCTLAHLFGSGEVGRDGVAHHNVDGGGVDATCVFNGKGHCVGSGHRWESQFNAAVVGVPGTPIDFLNATGSPWPSKVPPFETVAIVSIRLAHPFRNVRDFHGVVGQAQEHRRGRDARVVFVPNVDSWIDDFVGHPKEGLLTHIVGLETDFSCTSCLEFCEQQILNHPHVVWSGGQGLACPMPGELGVRGDVVRLVLELHDRRCTTVKLAHGGHP